MYLRHIFIFFTLLGSLTLIYFLQYHFAFRNWIYRNSWITSKNQTRPLVIILTREPSLIVLQKLNELINVGIETLIMSDKPLTNTTSKYSSRLLHINDATLKSYGLYRNRAWDRVFVWLYNQTSIQYVWIMEDDFSWADANDVKKFFDQYANDKTDLLSRNIIYWGKETLGWMWWPRTRLQLLPQSQWSGALNMLTRVSQRLIKAHQNFTLALLHEFQRNNSLQYDSNVYFQEFFIPTVAHINHLSMQIYDNSKLDVHVFPLSEENIRKSWNQGKRIFHPVKHQSEFLFHQIPSNS